MNNMEMIFVILVLHLEGLWQTEAVSVTGVSGGKIEVKCSHVNAFYNVKYFCKGTCKNEDILISSRKKGIDSNKKYSIVDKGNTFYVTISDLSEDDSGTYWCGIVRIGFDTYNEVILTVTKGNIKDTTNDVSDLPQSTAIETVNTKSSSSKMLVYVGAGLGVAVLALAVVLLLFFRHRNRNNSSPSGKVHDTVYATVLSKKQDAHGITTFSSRASEDDQETDGRTNSVLNLSSTRHQDTSRVHADNVYSNVSISSEPQLQPESVFYSTVSFNKHTGGSPVTSRAAAVTYSTIEYASREDSVVYCNL